MYEDNGLHEKSIYIGIEDNSYYVKLTQACPCDQSEETKYLDFNQDDGLISEAVNILLMRYLALTNYEGTLCFQTITIDGKLTTSNYVRRYRFTMTSQIINFFLTGMYSSRTYGNRWTLFECLYN